MKTYIGARGSGGCIVRLDGRPLPHCLHLRNHSPTGFEWGYGGSGPAQLALAILVDHLGNETEALQWYQGFKWALVSQFPHEGFELTSDAISEWLRNQKDRRP